MTAPSSDGAARPRRFAWLRSLLGRRAAAGSVRDAIAGMIERRDAAPIAADERTLIANILALHNLTASDVMVPRADIVAVDLDTPMDELVKLMTKEAHSRLPIYRETLDDVIGIVHIKDVLAALGRTPRPPLAELKRDALFVAPSMRMLDLLLEMRLKRIHMALVVDEYGGVDGLVTIEDLVEEIVGEIEDEHDRAEGPFLVERPDGTLIADGRVDIEALEAKLGRVLSDEERDEVDTVGGLVFYLIDRVPRRGEIVAHPSGLEFEVLEVDPRRIRRLRIRRRAPEAQPGAEGAPPAAPAAEA